VEKVKDAVYNVGLNGQPQGGIGLKLARQMIEAAEKKAYEVGVAMVIAVVDAGGHLVAQHRMDNSLLASISISLDKAYTAAALSMSTEEVAQAAQPGEQLHGINSTNNGRIVTFGGGFPVYITGVLAGGIGVSGGSVDQDIAVARAGLSVL
jgi:uncharacterized protein GlcG (DUF336 family)